MPMKVPLLEDSHDDVVVVADVAQEGDGDVGSRERRETRSPPRKLRTLDLVHLHFDCVIGNPVMR